MIITINFEYYKDEKKNNLKFLIIIKNIFMKNNNS